MKKLDYPCRTTCRSQEKCIFQGLDSSIEDEIEKNSTANVYKRGQVIFLQGNPPNGIFCIHQGKVKIVIVNKEGKESIVRLATHGDILGKRALFSSEAYHASAIALEDSVILFFPKDFILNLVNKYPSVSLQLLSQLSKNVGCSDLHSTTLVHKNVRERLASLLIELKTKYGVKELDRYRLDIKLTREEMAAMIGTTHETLVRLITEFKNEEIIIQDGKIIYIINEQKLAEFANV